MPRKPPAPPAADDGDDGLEQLRNEYHALLLDLAKTPGSHAEQLKLAELIREAIADATGPNPAPAQAAQKIVQQTPYKRLGRRLAAAQRKHPPLWGAWTMALLLNPVVAVGAADIGIMPPPPPPPQQHQMPADPEPWRRASYRSLPEPDVLRGLADELSPEALKGLSAEQIVTRTLAVQQMMTRILTGPAVAAGVVVRGQGGRVSVSLPPEPPYSEPGYSAPQLGTIKAAPPGEVPSGLVIVDPSLFTGPGGKKAGRVVALYSLANKPHADGCTCIACKFAAAGGIGHVLG